MNFLEKIFGGGSIATATLLSGPPERITALGRLFVQALLCGRYPGCGHCLACQKFSRDSHPDFHLLQPDKGSHKINRIRELIAQTSFRPLEGNRSVVWIQEAELLTEGAANALLKTLEEPPSTLVFLLTTTTPERLLATIRSRCQKISLASQAVPTQERWRDLKTSWRQKFFPELCKKTASPFKIASELAESCLQQGEPEEFLNFLEIWWRDLAIFQATQQKETLLLAEAEDLPPYLQQKTPEAVFQGLDNILETQRALEGNVQKQLALERLFFHLMS